MTTPTALDNLGTVFTQIMTWIGSAFGTITGQPLLLLGLGIFVAGAVIGLVYRLIKG